MLEFVDFNLEQEAEKVWDPSRDGTHLMVGDRSKFRRFEVKAQFNEKQTQNLVSIS